MEGGGGVRIMRSHVHSDLGPVAGGSHDRWESAGEWQTEHDAGAKELQIV